MSKCRTPNTPRVGNGWLPLSSRSQCRPPAAAAGGRWLAGAVILTVRLAFTQEALRNSLAGDAAAEALSRQQQAQAYTVKSGDFRLLIAPSLGLDWNDNINASRTNALQDYIVRPTLGLSLSYPITQRNLLRFNVAFGYQDYLEHSQYSTWYIQSGSELSFDIYVKDFWINLHDRFSYIQDSSQQAAVANTGTYGTAQNSAGFNTTWDLEDVTLSLGYDHQNYSSTSQEFSRTDHASELVVGRGGFKFHPTLTAGLEGAISYTAYDQSVLNNNLGYSAGLYADWQPGHYLHVQPRFGYMIYQFEQTQTSQSIPASNQSAWYFDLTATHDLSDAVSYSFSAGHELTLGIYGNTIEDWYVRPTLLLRIMKNLTLNTSFSYQNGSQSLQTTPGSSSENYDWLTWGVGLSYPFMKRLTVGLNYRLTWRTSNYASREYTQDVVGLQLAYNLP
jgi:opacity protein-like surface antigen